MSSTRERDAEIRRSLSDLSGTRPLLCSAIRAHFKSLGVVVDEPIKAVPGTLLTRGGKVWQLQRWPATNGWYANAIDECVHLGDATNTDVNETLIKHGFSVTKHTFPTVLPCD